MITLDLILKEFRKSLVPDSLTLANVQFVEGDDAVRVLTETAISKAQRVTSYTTYAARKIQQKYSFAHAGGWLAYGCNPEGTASGEVAYFKGFYPRRELDNGRFKEVKYETPQGCEALPLQPWVDNVSAQAIYQKFGVTPLEGETFWQLVRRCNLPIAITEGVKKALAMIAHGMPAIALRGIGCWHRKGTRELHQAISHFATPRRAVYVIFDQDQKPKTQIAVRTQILKLGADLEALGCRVFVPTWGAELGKGVDDALYNQQQKYEKSQGILQESNIQSNIQTEISRTANGAVSDSSEGSEPNAATSDKSTGFRVCRGSGNESNGGNSATHRANPGGSEAEINLDGQAGTNQSAQAWFDELIKDAPTLNDYRRYGRISAALAVIDRFNRLSCPAERETEGEYLPELSGLRPGAIHVLDASMNTGKTYRIGQDWVRRAKADGWFVLVLSPLNSLGQQTALNWELPHIHAFGTKADEQKALWAQVSHENGIVMCPDSLHRIPGWVWDRPVLLILDEANQVIDHTCTGNTLGARQSDILEKLGAAAQHAIATGAIVLSEDGIPDRAVNFIKAISGAEAVRVIKHYKKATPWNCKILSGSASGYRARLLETVHQGNRVVFVTSSQREGKRIERAIAKIAPNVKVTRIDSETNQQGDFNAFFDAPDSWLEVNQPDVLILSPSARSGVSIQGNVPVESAYFSIVWGYFPTLATDSHMQLLGRFRPPVPRIIWVPSFITASGDESLFKPRAIKRRVGLNAKALAGVYDIGEMLEADGDRAEDMLRIETAVTDYLAESRAVTGAQKSIAHDALVHRLEAAGHIVQTETCGRNKGIGEFWEEIKKEIWREDAEAIASATIDPEEHTPAWAHGVLSGLETALETRTIAHKVLWREEFPGVLFNDTEECYQALCQDYGAMRRGVLTQAKVENLEAAKEGDRHAAESIFRDKIRAWHRLPKNYVRALLLSKTGILNMLDSTYTNSDLRAIAVKREALKWASEINYWLRLQIKESQSPVEIVNKLLRKLGLSAEAISRPGKRIEKRLTVWKVVGTDNPVRMQLLEASQRKLSSSVSSICINGSNSLQIDDTNKTPHSPPSEIEDLRAMFEQADTPEAIAAVQQVVIELGYPPTFQNWVAVA